MSSLAQPNTRIAKFDNIKAFLMLVVVFGHGISPFITSPGVKWATLWLYSFHMPLFVYLTGLFAKRTVSTSPLDFKKIVGFGLLGMFMKVSTHITLLACGQNPSFTILEENGVAWFIFVIAVHMIIAYAVRKLTPWKVLLTSTLLALVIGFADDIGNVFVLSRIFTFFPAFYLGVITDKEKLLKFANKPLVRILSLIVFLAFTIGIYFVIDKAYPLRYLLTGNNPYYEYVECESLGVLLRSFCYLLSFVLGFCVISFMPNRRVFLLTFCGSRTLSVYALHRLVQFVMEVTFLCAWIKDMQPRYLMLIVMGFSVLLTIVLSLKPFEYILYPFTNWDKFFYPVIRWFRKPEYK